MPNYTFTVRESREVYYLIEDAENISAAHQMFIDGDCIEIASETKTSHITFVQDEEHNIIERG